MGNSAARNIAKNGNIANIVFVKINSSCTVGRKLCLYGLIYINETTRFGTWVCVWPVYLFFKVVSWNNSELPLDAHP
jgi:hypothetical protein